MYSRPTHHVPKPGSTRQAAELDLIGRLFLLQMYCFLSFWGNFLNKIGVSLLLIEQNSLTLHQES